MTTYENKHTKTYDFEPNFSFVPQIKEGVLDKIENDKNKTTDKGLAHEQKK